MPGTVRVGPRSAARSPGAARERAARYAAGAGCAIRPLRRPGQSRRPVKDRLRAMRGLGSIATGQRVLEAVEAAQAIRRGDLRGAAVGARPGTVRRDGDRARAHVCAFRFAAEQLRLPGYPPAIRWQPGAAAR